MGHQLVCTPLTDVDARLDDVTSACVNALERRLKI